MSHYKAKGKHRRGCTKVLCSVFHNDSKIQVIDMTRLFSSCHRNIVHLIHGMLIDKIFGSAAVQ